MASPGLMVAVRTTAASKSRFIASSLLRHRGFHPTLARSGCTRAQVSALARICGERWLMRSTATAIASGPSASAYSHYRSMNSKLGCRLAITSTIARNMHEAVGAMPCGGTAARHADRPPCRCQPQPWTPTRPARTPTRSRSAPGARCPAGVQAIPRVSGSRLTIYPKPHQIGTGPQSLSHPQAAVAVVHDAE